MIYKHISISEPLIYNTEKLDSGNWFIKICPDYVLCIRIKQVLSKASKKSYYVVEKQIHSIEMFNNIVSIIARDDVKTQLDRLLGGFVFTPTEYENLYNIQNTAFTPKKEIKNTDIQKPKEHVNAEIAIVDSVVSNIVGSKNEKLESISDEDDFAEVEPDEYIKLTDTFEIPESSEPEQLGNNTLTLKNNKSNYKVNKKKRR